MSSTQPATNSPSLPINIRSLIRPKEQSNTRNLVSNSTSLHRIQLSNLTLSAAFPCPIKYCLRHACLDQSRTDGVNADSRAGELVRDCLGD